MAKPEILSTILTVAIWLASPVFAQVSQDQSESNVSKRIQNIAPEEMWNRIIHCTFPAYPGLARVTHITGTVDIGLGISPDGSVADHHYRVLSGPPLLVQSAIDAILEWKFQPNVLQGGEVTWSRVRALVRFNPDGTTAVDLAPAILPDNFGDPGIPVIGLPKSGPPRGGAVSRPETAPACVELGLSVRESELRVSVRDPGSYTNTYFGFSLHWPSGWLVADDVVLDAMNSLAEKAAQARNNQDRKYILYFALPDGPNGSSFVEIWAAEFPQSIKSASEYFPNTNLLSDKTFTRGPEQVKINGSKLYRGDQWGDIDGRMVYFIHLVTDTRKMILAIDTEANAPAAAEEILKELDLKITQ